MTSDDQKIQVQQATDIVDLIGEHLALTRKGKEFLCLCPFHDDHRPSMHVVPDKQIYKCFSCGAGGDVFGFVMNYHKMTFPEALKHLADRAGIVLEQRGREPSEGPSERQLLVDAHQRALAFFQKMLVDEQQGEVARGYLDRRGVSQEMIEAFQIGYAPDQWDTLVTALQRRQFDTRGMELGGIISRSDRSGKLYDRFRHRLIFPICDALGRPIAFGGRKLREEDEPKYLNSPEHGLFNKSATLYGLHLAKKAMISRETAVVVEGYTDVIACHQGGESNVVATLGTALTAQHVKELRRFVKKVVLVYDADEAGQKAADRALEIFLTESVDVAIAVLPQGLDPADLLGQADGVARWREAIEGAQDALNYQFARFRERLEHEDSITGREQAATAYVQQLGTIGLGRVNPIRRALLVRQLAELLRMPERTVERLLTSAGSRASGGVRREMREEDGSGGTVAAGPSVAPVPRAFRTAERHLIGVLLHRPDWFHRTLPSGESLDEAVTPSELLSPDAARLYERIYDRLAGDGDLVLAALLASLAEQGKSDLASLATDCERDVAQCSDGEELRLSRLLEDAVAAIRSQHDSQAYQRARSQAANAEGGDQALQEIVEHLRNRPHPGRMPVIRS